MLVLLPVLSFVLLWDVFARRRPLTDPREAFLAAALVWGVFLAASTEALSLFNWLTLPWLAVAWGGATLASALAAARQRVPTRSWLPLPFPRSPVVLLMGGAVVLIVAATGLIAILAWPNNADSMVYHLGRVVHWVQNRSVAFYPSNIARQLHSAPWSEYAILHLTVLSGDSRFGNLVQWSSMLGSLIGVSLIARQLGASPRSQIFAVLFCATLPMGILQATSTQNDYVAAFWLVCLTHALLVWRERPSSAVQALHVGASLGLAVLSKGTGYIFALPLLLLLFFPRPARPMAGLVKTAPVAVLLALALNAPQYVRSLELFGAPLTALRPDRAGIPVRGFGLTNDVFSPQALASNIIRNVALQLATPLPAVNSAIEDAIKDWHARFGIDVNDRRTTWSEYQFRLPPLALREHLAGNPAHLTMIGLAIGGLVFSRTLRRDGLTRGYALALVLGFVLFCLLLKWQPFHSRLQLPLFVLWSPLIGAVIGRWTKVSLVVTVIAMSWSVPYVLSNEARPLLGEGSIFTASPIEQSFRQGLGHLPGYTGAANYVRSLECSEVGLVLEWDDWEYPFWLLLPEAGQGRVRLEHVAVENSSRRLNHRPPPFIPCALIATANRVSDPLMLGERQYRPAWSGGGVTVLVNRQ